MIAMIYDLMHVHNSDNDYDDVDHEVKYEDVMLRISSWVVEYFDLWPDACSQQWTRHVGASRVHFWIIVFNIRSRFSGFYNTSESRRCLFGYKCISESLFSIFGRDSEVFMTPLNHKYFCFEIAFLNQCFQYSLENLMFLFLIWVTAVHCYLFFFFFCTSE